MLSRYSERISQIMKDARSGNNAMSNCGYLTEYAIQSLSSLLNGRDPEVRIVSTKSSANATTTSVVTAKVKSEHRAIGPITTVVGSTPIRADVGLHSRLPFPSHLIVDIDNNTESYVVDITDVNKTIKRTKANSPDELTQQLKMKSKAEGNIIYGDVMLVRPGHDTGHVLAFVADENEVFYIDGQLYNGITKQGSPIFSHFKTALASDNSRAYYFHGEDNVRKNAINGFQAICFYLVYGAVNRTLDNTVAIKSEPGTASTPHLVPASIAIRPDKRMATLTRGATQEAVAALPNSVVRVAIGEGVTPEAVAALSNFVTSVAIGPGVRPEVAAALPNSVIGVAINPGVRPEVAVALPKSVTHVAIGPGTMKEAVAVLSSSVTCVQIYDGVTQEVVAALPTTVSKVAINKTVTDEFKRFIENIYNMNWEAGRGERRQLQSTTTITNTLNAQPALQLKRSLEADEHTVIPSDAKRSSSDKDLIEKQKIIIQQQQQEIQLLRSIVDAIRNQNVSALDHRP
jgi:hypothetical protein